jgi:hypothetical protein
MRRSCFRLGGFFNIKGKHGELTEKQRLLKEDLERPYFKGQVSVLLDIDTLF